MDEKQLLDYACLRFEEEKYDEALEAFVLAYSKGYEREWILENIYACYMAGNEPAFRETYEKQSFDSGVSYESCTLDFIPYKDGEYYIFDKKCAEFCGKFSMVELEHREPLEVLKHVEFSAAAVEFDGNWNQYQDLLAEAVKRKIYAVCHDMNRGMSYWKIPELGKYVENVRMFPDQNSMQQYFHENTAVYLPKIVYGENQELSDLFDREHAYRLTPEGRNTENVLLTIAIPTIARGNLVLERVRNLLKMTYDAEIEIAISKNGIVYYEEEYQQVSQSSDARINYYDHRRSLKYYENWRYVVEMSKGRYVLLVADEDDIRLESLEHYFKLLMDCSQIGLLRARTDVQYSSLNTRQYGKAGLDAFALAFLRQNYISGLIIKRELFQQAHVQRFDCFQGNIFYKYYAHEWWCTTLCMKGDYMEEPISLIVEGDSRFEEEEQRNNLDAHVIEDEKGEQRILPRYSTYKARLEQFDGQLEFLKWFCEHDNKLMFVGLHKAIDKMKYLFKLARNYQYDREHFEDWVDQYAKASMAATDNLTDINQQQLLLQRIYENCLELLEHHYRLIKEDTV